MPFEPKPGLVIRFDFLWKEEEQAGRIEGRKDRPCAIILAAKPRENGTQDVVLCPITHSLPRKGESAVEIPVKLTRHLNLDDGRSWIRTHQVNTVEWEKDRLPFGVVPAHKGQWVFGQLPHGIGKHVFEQVRDNIGKKRLRNVRR
ncbi:MAG: type II toxin-antitoxin system PemK/MazF family toxin [Gammaproteobacteria bacterium]|nr:type II toxin-antitoxin system PemK/MazF family toxin [Gammaproteobacteria bacterium]